MKKQTCRYASDVFVNLPSLHVFPLFVVNTFCVFRSLQRKQHGYKQWYNEMDRSRIIIIICDFTCCSTEVLVMIMQ